MSVCPYCSFAAPPGFSQCPQCHLAIRPTGNLANATLVAPAAPSTLREKRNLWVVMGGWGAIVTGFLAVGSAHESSILMIGLIALMGGIVTLVVTKNGKDWINLTPGQRLAVIPGLVAGVGAFLIVGVVAVLLGTAIGDTLKEHGA